MLEIEQAIYLKQNVNFQRQIKVWGGHLPLNVIFVRGKCLEVSKMAI